MNVKKKARVVNAQPVEQDGGSGNYQASSESESGEDVIKCLLCDKFYLTEASKTKHFKHKHRTKMPCSYENCNSNFANPKALENHEKLHSVDPTALHKCDKCDYRFQFKSELQQYAIKHIKEAKYKCDKCGLKYKRKNKMKRHILLCVSDKVI